MTLGTYGSGAMGSGGLCMSISAPLRVGDPAIINAPLGSANRALNDARCLIVGDFVRIECFQVLMLSGPAAGRVWHVLKHHLLIGTWTAPGEPRTHTASQGNRNG